MVKGSAVAGQMARSRWYWLLLGVLAVAAFFRFYQLSSLPPGPYYDEAANVILASEIAAGDTRPLFITSYTGKEVLFFYLAAGLIKMLGPTLLSLRLTSALIGLATVGLTFWLGWELFADQEHWQRRGVALASAALMAVSFWHVAISRYGFRAISQPLTQALTLLFLWRGLRRGSRLSLVLGGLFCGLTAYTYLASRIVPLALTPWVLGAWLANRGERRRAAGQLLLFGLAAAVVVAPLAGFFLQHPEAFGTRMGQVSFLNPELNQGDPWGALWRAAAAAWGMFTARGDPQWRFGIVGRPVFDPFVGGLFYLGLLYALYRLVRGPRAVDRACYLALLLWLPLLLIPSILGVKEVPHSLRAIGVMPFLFFFPAFGLVMVVRGLRVVWQRVSWLSAPRVMMALAALLFVQGGLLNGRAYFVEWRSQPQPYYENDADLADAARALNRMTLGERDVFISSVHFRHPTMALLAESYERTQWLVGQEVMVFPPPDSPGAVYVFPHSALPAESLLALLGKVASGERHLGPDGDTAFLIYQLPPGVAPELSPQHTLHADLGHRIELLGYDLSPAAAGGTLALTLYWRVLAPVETGDYLLFAHLQDAWGFRWSSADVFDFPSVQWQSGQLVVQRRQVAVPVTAPPGDYEVVVGFFSQAQDSRLPRLDAQGRVVGTTATLAPVAVRAAVLPPDVKDLNIQQPLTVRWDGLRLLGLERDRTSVRQGETLYLGLFWQAERALPDLFLSLSLDAEGGGVSLPLWYGRPVHGSYPTGQWPVGAVVLDRYGLTVPQDIPAGDYELRLAVGDGGAVSLVDLHVEAVDRRLVAPPIQHPLLVNLGNRVEFLGYDLERDEIAPGETLHLTLYWRALAEMQTSYTVFTHLLDSADQIRGQQDNPPVNGSYPTTLWLPGEVVVDAYALTVDADAPLGEHLVEIGMYLAETGERLPVLDEAGQAIGDRVLLGRVLVVQH
ncbi:MAG: hypothetical protein ACOYZ7_15390 [Chloroflexota bacterium]